MPYQYADQRQDFSDYASGKVFYNLPRHPAFPIRLASEIFQRCLHIHKRNGLKTPIQLYDPLCGGAYHLATLAYFHWDQISEIIASDVDADALAVAARNLSLLTLHGLEQRTQELNRLYTQYEKVSHSDALESARVLKRRLESNLSTGTLATHLFQADALNPNDLARGLKGKKPNLVLTDVPYERQTSWHQSTPLPEAVTPIHQLLGVLIPHLSVPAVVAVAAPKHLIVSHPAYRTAGKFQLGLRRVTFLQPNVNQL